MRKTIIILLVLLFVLLAMNVPLQAGRNLFRPEKEQDDPEMSGSKTKLSQEQVKKWETITQSMQQENPKSILSYYYFLLAVFFVLTIILFYLLHKYYWERYVVSLDNPWNLFRELCSAHDLNRLEQQVLRHIAEEQHWDNPLQVFIEPSHLKSALDLKQFEKSHSLIESLLEKLFNLKNESLMETQAIDSSSPVLNTTIIYRKEGAAKSELSGIRSGIENAR
ncbi:MAG: hypothetical protein LBU34_08945 [Planctomycetaceae bacterium]|jgi:preprotein translocase subunit SecG|nr:hypothetical protein [Planctomycetaceae bacterium]